MEILPILAKKPSNFLVVHHFTISAFKSSLIIFALNVKENRHFLAYKCTSLLLTSTAKLPLFSQTFQTKL